MGGDGRHSAWWCNATGGDDVAQELDAGLPELALLRVGGQAGCSEEGERLLQVPAVVLLGLAELQDVVQVRGGVLQAADGAVDETLERVARIAHAEGHAGELEQPEQRCDGRLRDAGVATLLLGGMVSLKFSSGVTSYSTQFNHSTYASNCALVKYTQLKICTNHAFLCVFQPFLQFDL